MKLRTEPVQLEHPDTAHTKIHIRYVKVYSHPSPPLARYHVRFRKISFLEVVEVVHRPLHATAIDIQTDNHCQSYFPAIRLTYPLGMINRSDPAIHYGSSARGRTVAL